MIQWTNFIIWTRNGIYVNWMGNCHRCRRRRPHRCRFFSAFLSIQLVSQSIVTVAVVNRIATVMSEMFKYKYTVQTMANWFLSLSLLFLTCDLKSNAIMVPHEVLTFHQIKSVWYTQITSTEMYLNIAQPWLPFGESGKQTNKERRFSNYSIVWGTRQSLAFSFCVLWLTKR